MSRRSSRRGRSRRGSAGGRVGLGTLALGGVAVGLYFLLRPRAPQGSDPSEWLPWTSPPPLVSGAMPMTANSVGGQPHGAPCRSSAQCVAGCVCVNGSCVTEAEWLA